MPSNHLILCRPLLLPSIFPSIKVSSNESVLCIRWFLFSSKYSYSFYLYAPNVSYLPYLFLVRPNSECPLCLHGGEICKIKLCWGHYLSKIFHQLLAISWDELNFLASLWDLYRCMRSHPKTQWFKIIATHFLITLGLLVASAKLTHVFCVCRVADQLRTGRPQMTVACGCQPACLPPPLQGHHSVRRLAGKCSGGSWIPRESKWKMEMLPGASAHHTVSHTTPYGSTWVTRAAQIWEVGGRVFCSW